MIASSIKTGFRQMWASKRMVVIFFVMNLIFGLILVMPFRSALSEFVGQTVMGAELAGRLNFDFLFEFLKENASLTSIYSNMFLIVPALYWLLGLFLSGGAFSVFARGEGFSPAAFWGGAASYFGRFFRLVLWSIPVFALFFCLQYLWSLIQRIAFGSDPYQNVLYWGEWIKFGLRLLGILMFGMVLDYARIHIVLSDERKTRNSLWHALKFVFANFGKTLGLALVLYLAGVAVLVVYNPIVDALSAPNALVIALLFLVQQLYMFWRMMLRLTLYAGEMHLYRSLQPEAMTAEQPSQDLGLEGAPA